MKKFLLIAALAFAGAVEARMVSVDTVVCNDGAIVSVPVKVDDVSDASQLMLVLNYDSTVVALTGAKAGAVARADDFTYATDDGGHVTIISAIGDAQSGEICTLRFYARNGAAGQFSDLTVASAHFSASDGVRDLSVANPISVTNGMIRLVAKDAELKRLENAFTIWPETTLGFMILADGDKLKASAARKPIVAGSVASSGLVPVEAPINGWHTGRYNLLKTKTLGLTFALEGADNVSFGLELSEGGYVIYYADVAVEGEVPVEIEDGELAEEVVSQIRSSLAETLAEHPGVETLKIKGDAETIPVAADLGIGPAIDVLGTEMTATYTKPTISIIDFDFNTGLVRIKVTPGEGNQIRTVLATGCIHVYGTSNLGEKMRRISETTFDLTPYLQEDTKGEADLTVAVGTHTFLKVKASTTVQEIDD